MIAETSTETQRVLHCDRVEQRIEGDRKVKVAVLGFGTVGVGVYEMLKASAELEAGPVLVRPGKADAPFKVTAIEDITSDATVDAVAEVMGGVEPAFTYAMAAIRAGKHFLCPAGSRPAAGFRSRKGSDKNIFR